MPTYEYGCEACGNQWEFEQRISADPIKKCPSCGKSRARRLISGGNFILKGGGWYSDLYHKPASSTSSSKEASSSSDTGTKAESTKSESTKSESKSDSSASSVKKAANE